MYIDIIGWIGNIFFIAGAVYLARKKSRGFYYNVIGNILYIIFGLLDGKSSILILSIWLVCINIYGIYNWKKQKGIK